MNKGTNENQRGVLTDIGQQKINAHAAAGTKLIISQFVIGDGNGQPVEPIKSATALTHEIRKRAHNRNHYSCCLRWNIHVT